MSPELIFYKNTLETIQLDILHAETIFTMGKSIQKIVIDSKNQEFIQINYGLFLDRVMFSFNAEIVLTLTNLFSHESSILKDLHEAVISDFHELDKELLKKNAENYYLTEPEIKDLYNINSRFYGFIKMQKNKTPKEVVEIRVKTLKDCNLPTTKDECLDKRKKELCGLYSEIQKQITQKDPKKGLVVMKKDGQEITLNMFRNEFLAHHDKGWYDISRWVNMYFVFTNPGTEILLKNIIKYLDIYYKLLFGNTYKFKITTRNDENNLDLNFLKEKIEYDVQKRQEELKLLNK